MSKFIGISEDRMHHIIGVARECYRLALERGHSKEFAKMMFMIGWNHDVGYEFCSAPLKHAIVSFEMLKLLAKYGHTDNRGKLAGLDVIPDSFWTIAFHGSIRSNDISEEELILNLADLSINSKGQKVSFKNRLNEIYIKYGADSPQYVAASYFIHQSKSRGDINETST